MIRHGVDSNRPTTFCNEATMRQLFHCKTRASSTVNIKHTIVRCVQIAPCLATCSTTSLSIDDGRRKYQIMRLLEYNDAGDVSLTENFLDDKVPPYAILSHTWGEEEVLLQNLVDGTARNKVRYGKIQFCGEQSRRDGLRHFWIDTCCIDKTSSAELQETISCMFRWYRNAAKCYVYLADVSRLSSDTDDETSQSHWKTSFRKSRWFTRGWTLQELIAPASVVFFSQEGIRLGSKKSLEQSIHEITRIPLRILRGSHLSDISISQRMEWIANRETTRQEDKAYSLHGIFDVYMPLLYGEGRERAFLRLQEAIDKDSRAREPERKFSDGKGSKNICSHELYFI